MCGEGGEYESAVFDCPLFKNKKIVAVESAVVHHDKNEFAPVAYLEYKTLEVIEKGVEEKEMDREVMERLIKEKIVED